MGLHAGIVCFKGDLSHLAKVLAPRGISVGPPGAAVTEDELYDAPLQEHREDSAIEHCGWRFSDGLGTLLDRSMLLSTDPDMPVELAKLTGHAAASWAYASSTGSHFYSLAKPEGIVWAYSHCHTTMTKAWSVGTAPTSGQDCPFDDSDYIERFEDAMEGFGLPRHAFAMEGKWQPIEVAQLFSYPRVKGPLDQELSTFYDAHKIVEAGCLPSPIARVFKWLADRHPLR